MLTNMFERIVPIEFPKVGDKKMIPTGPMEAVEGIVTAVDPEGVVILKLPSGMRMAGYYGRFKKQEGVSRMRQDGSAAPDQDEAWIYNPVER